MWLMLAGLAGVCGGGCRGEDLTAPRGAAPAPARVLVVADTLCVRAQFTITGPTSVTTNFPTAAECPGGLRLLRSQPATWVQTPNRRLRLFVRVTNLTGQAVQLPVRLYLPANGTTVVLPAGTPASKVVAFQPDSSEGGGGWVWFIGGTSVLAAGDSTAEDTLTFQVQSPVTKARWQFQGTAASAGGGSGVAALPPDSIASATWLALHDSINLEPASAAYPIPFPRNLILVTFRENTPLNEKQAAIDAIGGQVVGGSPIGNGGVYYVTIVGDGTTTPLFNAIAQLKALPQVLLATPELVPLSPARLPRRATLPVADTARPPIPAVTVFPYDSSLIVSPPGDTATRFLRNIFAVTFDDSTSGPTVMAFFQSFGATIIAGAPAAREYYVRTSDPGPTWQAYDQLHTAMHNSGGVRYAVAVSYRGPIGFERAQSATFEASAPVPALPPDSIPTWVLADSSIDGNGYTRQLLEVLFEPCATQPERQAAIESVGGAVVGGLPMTSGDGYYLVQVPEDGSGAQLDSAVVQLMMLPAVQHVGRQWRGTGPPDLRPPPTRQVQSPVTKARWQFQGTVVATDTTTPALPSTWVPSEDSTVTAQVSSSREALIYRRFVSVEFLPTTTGTTIRAFMARYGAVVAGGFPWGPRGSYVFEVPDPGSSLAAVDSLIALMRSEPGIADAGRLYFRDVLQPRGRYPVDGASGRAAPDTSTPPLPNNWLPTADSSLTVAVDQTRTAVVHRTFVAVEFTPTATGAQIRAVLSKYQGVVVGGLPEIGPRGTYVIQLPDPGSSLAALNETIAHLRAEPGVADANRIYYRIPVSPRDRSPADTGLTTNRSDWTGSTTAPTRPWLAVREPLVLESVNEDTLTFRVQSPSTKARWQFQGTVVANDTTTPAVPGNWIPLEDSTLTAAVDPARTSLVYRTFATVEFDSSASGAAIHAVLARYGATVAGGLPWGPRGIYVLELPDPGATLGAVDSLLALIATEPGVAAVGRLYYRDPLVPRGRYPVDGGFLNSRSAWTSSSPASVAGGAIHAPVDAWGPVDERTPTRQVQSPVTKGGRQVQATAAQITGPLPVLPVSTPWPQSPLLAVAPTDTTLRYYRNLLGVLFDSTATNSEFTNLQVKYGATLLGGIGAGTPNRYYVLQFPDPGAAFASLEALAAQIRLEPGVLEALQLTYGAIRVRGRFPVDTGLAPNRPDWTASATAPTRPWLAVREALVNEDTLRLQLQSPVTKGGQQGQETSTVLGTVPPVPAFSNLPSDSTRTALASDSTRYYRDIMGVAFDDTTSDITVLSVFNDFGATVVGGYPREGNRGAYLIRIPDPGPTFSTVDSLASLLGSRSGVDYAFPVAYRTRFDPRAQDPGQGAVGDGADWPSSGSGSSASQAPRTSPASGSATGADGGSVPQATALDAGGPLPPNPDHLMVPDDSLETIRGPLDSVVTYYRTMAQVQFKSGATGGGVATLLQKYQAQIVGGVAFSGVYVLRYADPGSSWSSVMARVDSLAAEPIVLRAMPMTRSEGPPLIE